MLGAGASSRQIISSNIQLMTFLLFGSEKTQDFAFSLLLVLTSESTTKTNPRALRMIILMFNF